MSTDRTDEFQEFIEHYGVKGMRWGVRKSSRSKTKRTPYAKSPSRLNDAELKRRIQRLEMEKRYNDLNAPVKSKGEKVALDILQQSGKSAGSRIATSVALAVGAKVVSMLFRPETAKLIVSKL